MRDFVCLLQGREKERKFTGKRTAAAGGRAGNCSVAHEKMKFSFPMKREENAAAASGRTLKCTFKSEI